MNKCVMKKMYIFSAYYLNDLIKLGSSAVIGCAPKNCSHSIVKKWKLPIIVYKNWAEMTKIYLQFVKVSLKLCILYFQSDTRWTSLRSSHFISEKKKK